MTLDPHDHQPATGANRGPEVVKRKLVDAAKDLMTMMSPRQVSGRELARHAGVNYGLIHHYFGSKDAVFAEAFTESTEAMGKRWDTGGMVPVNTSDEARSYRTFAKIEVDHDHSPITDLLHRIVNGQAAIRGCDNQDPDMLGDVAIAAALQFGWGAFEEEIVTALAEYGIERDQLRALVAQRSTRLRGDDWVDPPA